MTIERGDNLGPVKAEPEKKTKSRPWWTAWDLAGKEPDRTEITIVGPHELGIAATIRSDS